MLFWTRKEQVQCAVSTASVVAFAYLLVAVLFDFDWAAIVVRHVIPLLIMNYWLVMVTYLQHHESDTNVRCFFPLFFVYVGCLGARYALTFFATYNTPKNCLLTKSKWSIPPKLACSCVFFRGQSMKLLLFFFLVFCGFRGRKGRKMHGCVRYGTGMDVVPN